MSLFKRPGSSVYHCEFEFKGIRYRESTGATTKTEAQAYEVKRRAEVKEDAERQRLGVKRLTMGGLADLWLQASESSHRDFKNNASRVRKLFGEELELVKGSWVLKVEARAGLDRDLPVQDLTQEHLHRLKAERIKEGNSPSTFNREVSLVQSLLGYAKTLNIVLPAQAIIWSQKNKAASLKFGESGGKLRWLLVEEEHKLLTSLADEADKRSGDQGAIDALDLAMFLLDTGARYAEVAEVRWDQIDLRAGTISLYRSKTQNESVLHLPSRTQNMLRGREEAMEAWGSPMSSRSSEVVAGMVQTFPEVMRPLRSRTTSKRVG